MVNLAGNNIPDLKMAIKLPTLNLSKPIQPISFYILELCLALL